MDGEGANEWLDELAGILFVIARGPLGAASVLMAVSPRCCCGSLSAYIPEFTLMGVSLTLMGGGLEGGTKSTSMAFRSRAEGCCLALSVGSFLRVLLVEPAEGPDGGNLALLRRSVWLASRVVTT